MTLGVEFFTFSTFPRGFPRNVNLPLDVNECVNVWCGAVPWNELASRPGCIPASRPVFPG